VEIGEHVPAGHNPQLADRFLFMMDYYQGRRPFQSPDFIEAYAPTCWLKISEARAANLTKPVFEDDEFSAFNRPVQGVQIFSLPWPAAYDKFKPPRPVF
jgi:hypothetical protein